MILFDFFWIEFDAWRHGGSQGERLDINLFDRGGAGISQSFENGLDVFKEFGVIKTDFACMGVNDAKFIIFEFNSACHEFFDCFDWIRSDCASFWVWHETFGAKSFGDFAQVFHHVWSGNCSVKSKPAFGDFGDEVFISSFDCTG